MKYMLTQLQDKVVCARTQKEKVVGTLRGYDGEFYQVDLMESGQPCFVHAINLVWIEEWMEDTNGDRK